MGGQEMAEGWVFQSINSIKVELICDGSSNAKQ